MKPFFLARFVGAFVLVSVLSTGAQVSNYRDIKYPQLPEFKIPKPEVYTLKNGMRIFLMEDHELPLIRVNARIRTGSNYEPAEKTGLASIMGAVQRSGGTERQTGDEIDDFLAAHAATIETGIGGDAGFASMDCLKQDFDDVFKVFGEILRKPRFAEDKLEVAKIAENSSIARRNDDVGEITSREIARIVYGPDSPLARNTEYATIGAIAREDLVAWHKQYYQPNSILMGVVGDFDSAQMRQKIEAAFGDWLAGPEFKRPEVPFRKDPPAGYFLVEKSDVNQANIVMAHLGIETANPDFFAAQVMNEVLSGGFSSRLFSNVRSRLGLAYSVYGSLGSGFYQPGLFRAGLQTKSENTTKGIEAVKAEIQGIINQPPSEEELKRAKDSILNSFVFHYDSRAKILSQQMTYAFYGLPEDFLEQYRANIDKVTIPDVTRVAKRYVHPEQLAVLVVGNPAEFGQPLTNLGPVKMVDITIPPPASTGGTVEKSPEAAAQGKKIWAAAVKAMGGEAFKKLESLQMAGKVVATVGGQSMTLQQSTTVVFPDKVRQVIETPMGKQIVVMNGASGFMQMGERIQDLPEAALKEQRQEQSRNLLFLLRAYDDPGLQVTAAGKEMVDGTECEVVAVDWKGQETRLSVAPDGKVLKQAHQGANPLTRVPGKLEVLFSDYRPEGAYTMPHRQSVRVDGQEVISATNEKMEVNPQVAPELFQEPEGKGGASEKP